MKVLAASDLHGNHSVVEWIVREADNADLLVLSGDLLGAQEGFETIEEAQREDARKICGILDETHCPVYYIMGNDDMVELAPESDRLRSVHACRHEIGRWNLVGYQYSLPFMGGIYEKPEEAIRQDLARLAGLVDADTVLVTHSPAFGVLDTGILDLHAGSAAILALVQEKSVRCHVHGHIHSQFGRSGVHFNVASGGRHRAMMIDLASLESHILQRAPGAD